MKKLLNKKNNKGFSLVELIVVVLIMGILAVALAPQVMKWVGNSKVSSDKSNAEALKSSVQTALAEWQATNNMPGSGNDASFNVNGSISGGIAHFTDLEDLLDEVTAEDYPKTQYDNAGFTVTINGVTGKVTVTCNAQSH